MSRIEGKVPLDKKRKMLLVVPHQDDEMLVGGSALYQFAQDKDWKTFVLYTTEGAAMHERHEVRMREAIRALKVLGVSEEQIIFLGYGNCWQGNYHIYNAPEKEELVSLKGKKMTFALPTHEEYGFYKTGSHHIFTRQNYKSDLINVILDIMPEVIIAVDMDDHEEHMATSLFLDECLADIVKLKRSYCPLVLKKFAYDGLWKGTDDYFFIPRIETLNRENRYNTTRNPSFQWDERIRFAIPKECDTYFLHNNILNKAVKKHISQDGWLCAVRLINSDIVYWYRRTDNLALLANIKVSSGEGGFLNDFKRIDTGDVRNKDTVWENCSWFPEDNDVQKSVFISWESRVPVWQIDIYESPESDAGEILDLFVRLDDGYEFHTGELKHKAAKNTFIFSGPHQVAFIELKVMSAKGRAGISEVEVFSELFRIEKYNLPIKTIMERPMQTKHICLRKAINYFDKKLFHLKAKLCLK